LLFAAALDGAKPPIESAWPGRRILIADDDAPVRDFHSQIAARVGVDADVVASGRDAIAALKSRRYDVALLDLNMPRLSGWEVLDFLRTRTELKPQRIFIITGFSDQQVSEADRDLVTAMLYKPVVADELRKLITLCLNGDFVDVKTVLRVTGHQGAAATIGAAR
jgi:CheY-like chemotaxis protein